MGVGGQQEAPVALPRKGHCTHCIGGWMRPTAGVHGSGISRFTGVRILNLPAHSVLLYRLGAIGPT
jgi:hypothetical protein